MNNGGKLSSEQKAYIRKVISDPVLFCDPFPGRGAIGMRDRNTAVDKAVPQDRDQGLPWGGQNFRPRAGSLVVVGPLSRRHSAHDLAY